MTTVAILSPDSLDRSHDGLWQTVLSRLQAALVAEGIDAVATPWTDHVDDAERLRGHACVLPLLAWGYHRDHARWRHACATWERADIAMANPASVLAWNADKRYLARLASLGVAIPATTWTEQVTAELLHAAFDETGADALIVKPAVSGGAWRTWKIRRGEAVDSEVLATASGTTMLVQPYLPTIASEGETSLLFFGGRLSHAVNKRPVAGDFRVQEEYGGSYTVPAEPPAGALALARQALDAIGEPLLYARIDTVPDYHGQWQLMEAELIEPDFYLGVDPRRGALFARALRDWIETGASGAR